MTLADVLWKLNVHTIKCEQSSFTGSIMVFVTTMSVWLTPARVFHVPKK